jgi:HPt (histidine-containing phosphotransfer) domain-containing protein
MAGVRGDEKLLCELVEMFRDDSESMLADMREALEQRDAARLASSTHGFIGSLGNFAAVRALDAARELEARARSGEAESAAPLFETLVDETRRLVDKLEAIRAAIEPEDV